MQIVKSSGFCEIGPTPACFSEQGGSPRRGSAWALQTNGDFSNGYFTAASNQTSATTGHGQKTKTHYHLRGGRNIRRPRTADARIAIDLA
jgi:hypothetical protein